MPTDTRPASAHTPGIHTTINLDLLGDGELSTRAILATIVDQLRALSADTPSVVATTVLDVTAELTAAASLARLRLDLVGDQLADPAGRLDVDQLADWLWQRVQPDHIARLAADSLARRHPALHQAGLRRVVRDLRGPHDDV